MFYEHYFHGRYEEALTEAKGLELHGEFRQPLFLAATYGQLGRPDDAEAELEKLRASWPRPVSEIRRELIERHALTPTLTDLLMEGLAKAGETL